MHIDMTMRRPEGVSPAAGDAVAMLLALAARFPRDTIEQGIEALIATLDAADGDPDLEDGDADCCPAGDDDMTTPDQFMSEREDDDLEPWLTAPHWPAEVAA